MKQFLKALPIPAAGVMLGLAALGNLLQSYSEGVRLVFGALALVLWVCLVLKAVFCWKGVCQAMEDPIAASVAGTFPMATMLLAVYAKPFAGAAAAQIIWLLGIALHVVLIVWFTVKFFGKFQLGRVFASYYIVYVGIVVASLTAPAFDMAGTVGTCAFWFGFVCLIALLALAASYVVLYKTKFGLRLMACGEHPQAADSVGINVYRMRYAGVLISGALGGLGGLVYITAGVSEWKFENGVAGFGFLALAVMIFGQWKPVNIGLAALLFALFRALSNVYTGIGLLDALNLPSTVYNMFPYIISLVVLVFVSKKSRAPKAEGIPYDKGQR